VVGEPTEPADEPPEGCAGELPIKAASGQASDARPGLPYGRDVRQAAWRHGSSDVVRVAISRSEGLI